MYKELRFLFMQRQWQPKRRKYSISKINQSLYLDGISSGLSDFLRAIPKHSASPILPDPYIGRLDTGEIDT